ncbi:hypothetical protein P170DRAFT_435925 [Aspergillus steynii IBT 23096]|uniref:Transcription initiation factor IIF subunit beta n=1 Tax=Aspergillus steynii IBT 23096 TaxID=1392250 RepID=A0A2I2GD01_9EURO|nr:uncharacterized protein P170DRAFT_435925 [Aspergillus steynii IBT 23096]PLB50742.1 hypothetical protein P170DRAFT_435925 [Aspergillus steynii IBT 23096]
MGPPIKQDPDASSPYIKADPDDKDTVLADVDDEDIFDDDGDLDFSNAAQNVWLSRIPRQLWENWDKLDDDEEIQVGTIRIEGPGNDIKRISLRLQEREDNKEVPKDYVLQRYTLDSEPSVNPAKNTYVFTEKEIAGQDNRTVVFGEARSALYESVKRDARRKERKKKWEPYVRKTINKQTSLVAGVSEEFNCLPVENEEFEELSTKRALEALKPKTKIMYIGGAPNQLLQGRTVLPTEKGSFVQAAKTSKPKAQENKTTRMPQNELLDLIYGCFREYRYWSFKDLKARLRQPEAYLKQTLELTAHLVKGGDFVNTWELKPEARESSYANAWGYAEPQGELAPATYTEDVSDEDASEMDNDETQFENVS